MRKVILVIPLVSFCLAGVVVPAIPLFWYIPGIYTLVAGDEIVRSAIIDSICFAAVFAPIAMILACSLSLFLVQWIPGRVRIPLLLSTLAIWAMPDVSLNQAISRAYSLPHIEVASQHFKMLPALTALLLRSIFPLAFLFETVFQGYGKYAVAASALGAGPSRVLMFAVVARGRWAICLVLLVSLSTALSFRYFGGEAGGFSPLSALIIERFYSLSSDKSATAAPIASLLFLLTYTPLFGTLLLPTFKADMEGDGAQSNWPKELRFRPLLLVPISLCLVFSAALWVESGRVNRSLLQLGLPSVFSDYLSSSPLTASLKISLAATLAAVALAVPAAYYCSRYQDSIAKIAVGIALLPLALPQETYAYALSEFTYKSSFWLVFALAFRVSPFIFLFTLIGLSSVSKQHISAALNLGATQWQCLKWLELPTAWPSALAGITLSMIAATTDYSLSMLLSREQQTFGVAITHTLIHHEDPTAVLVSLMVPLSTILLLFTIGVLASRMSRSASI